MLKDISKIYLELLELLFAAAAATATAAGAAAAAAILASACYAVKTRAVAAGTPAAASAAAVAAAPAAVPAATPLLQQQQTASNASGDVWQLISKFCPTPVPSTLTPCAPYFFQRKGVSLTLHDEVGTAFYFHLFRMDIVISCNSLHM